MCDKLVYVVTRNITFSLPVNLVRQAKIYAAEHDTTINAVVRELLQTKLAGEDRALAAAERVLQLAKQGPHSTVDPRSILRDDLYERG